MKNACHTSALGAIQLNRDMAKVSAIGIGLRSQTRMAHTMFEAFIARGVPLGAVATSKTWMSVLISEQNIEGAVPVLVPVPAPALHSASGLDS